MSTATARPMDRLPDALVALLRRAITRFVTGSESARDLSETLLLMNACPPASTLSSSDVVQAFRAIWRATPRSPTKTDRQWEVAYDTVLATCGMKASVEP